MRREVERLLFYFMLFTFVVLLVALTKDVFAAFCMLSASLIAFEVGILLRR